MTTKNNAKTPKVKEFLLDANIPLHDAQCIYGFEENNLTLPIVSIEELDKFKSGREQININARTFTRSIIKLTKGKNPTDWCSRGKGLGNFRIAIPDNDSFPEEMKGMDPLKKDNLILATVLNIKKKAEHQVIFVTKDLNLLLTAMALGIETQDYLADTVEVETVVKSSIKTVENVSEKLMEELGKRPYFEDIPLDNLENELPGECVDGLFIFKNERRSALVSIGKEKLVLLKKERKSFGIQPRNSEQAFFRHVLEDKDKSLVIATGSAGTGKTLLALTSALKQLKDKDYTKVFLARPMVEMGEKMGFLPGDAQAKVDPYMAPLYDNLEVIKDASSIKEKKLIAKWLDEDIIHISPLAFIRGRSLQKVIFIIDEAQNLTPHEIKAIITRAGEGSKVIFTGDIQQIDTPYLSEWSNGPAHVIDAFQGQETFRHVHLVKGERSGLATLAARLL